MLIRGQLWEILGIGPPVFPVKMGGAETTDQITAVLSFPFDKLIDQANFPLAPSNNPWEDGIEIIYPNCQFSEKDGLKLLANAGLRRPTHEHGIRFAQQHGESTTSKRWPFIVFLHQPRSAGGCRRVIYLCRGPHNHALKSAFFDILFNSDCAIAGVRPHKQPA